MSLGWVEDVLFDFVDAAAGTDLRYLLVEYCIDECAATYDSY